MRHEVRLPAVGDAVEGEVAEWYHATADIVQEGEPLVAIDIDKIVIDVPSPAAGTLTVSLPVGARVALADLLGWVSDDSREP
jgi:2-oxoglutarate dehydrogenase E2 component (dihydrolipoamide succinyltransferase)